MTFGNGDNKFMEPINIASGPAARNQFGRFR